MSKVQINFAFDTISEAVSFLAGCTKQGQVLLAADKEPAAPAAGKSKAEKPAAAPAPAAASAKPSAATGQTAAPAAEGIEYSVLQAAVFALAGKGDAAKAAAKAIAVGFGVGSFKELPAEKRAEALGLVNAKIAELDDEVA